MDTRRALARNRIARIATTTAHGDDVSRRSATLRAGA
jgi:hypothetical protein